MVLVVNIIPIRLLFPGEALGLSLDKDGEMKEDGKKGEERGRARRGVGGRTSRCPASTSPASWCSHPC